MTESMDFRGWIAKLPPKTEKRLLIKENIQETVENIENVRKKLEWLETCLKEFL